MKIKTTCNTSTQWLLGPGVCVCVNRLLGVVMFYILPFQIDTFPRMQFPVRRLMVFPRLFICRRISASVDGSLPKAYLHP